MATQLEITPRHLWTNGGDSVLLLKCVLKDGTSYRGFQWPLTVGATVEAPDWNPVAECGSGLHGWPWGFSLGDGKDPDWSGVWLVFAADPATVVDLGGKVKVPRGVIRYVGDWVGATAFVLSGQMAWVEHAASGAASATGWRGAASATGESGAASATGESGAASATGESGAASATGERGAASATGESGAASATGESGAASATGERGAASATGERGAASATGERGAASATGESGAASATGWRGAASATGWRGAASATGESGAASATGWRGAASATGESGAASATGWRGAASATGESGAASATGGRGAASATGVASLAGVTGTDGKVQCGPYGALALAWWNREADRIEMRVALVGCGDGTDGTLKAHVWYQLDAAGLFVEVK